MAKELKSTKTHENLKASVAGETHAYTDMYPGMAKAEKSHAGRFAGLLKSVQ
jgi:rubrerythrin